MLPLGVVLRLAFASVIGAALLVDLWVLGVSRSYQVPFDSSILSARVGAVLCIAALGLFWARWPQPALWAAAVATAATSILATTRVGYDGTRFAFFTEFVVLPVLFGAVLARSTLWRWPLAVGLAVVAESVAFRSDESAIRWIVAISMLVLLGAAGSAVVYIRLRDHERRSSIEVARQSERLELARELHDVVGHHVTGIVVLAQAAQFTAAGDGVAGRIVDDSVLADIEAAGLETLTSIRRLVGMLRTDATTAGPPRLADVEALVDDLRRTHSVVDLVVDERTRRDWVPADLATTVLRLVQEATTNVRKHGDPAASARFELSRSATAFVLVVENGLLDDATAASGYGLLGMRERVDALGGSMQAEADADARRWMLRITLPLVVGVGR